MRRWVRCRQPMFLEFWTQASRDKKAWEAPIAPCRHYRDHFAKKLVEDGIVEGSLEEGVDIQATAQVTLSLVVALFLRGVFDPQGANWQKVGEE